jgi:hypothetical protein
MDATPSNRSHHREPWNKGKLVGQKAPFKPKDVWALRALMIPNFGALTGTDYTATLNEPLPEKIRKIDLDEQGVYWSKRVTLPYKPHIGTLSCSPEIDSINSLTRPHGHPAGNGQRGRLPRQPGGELHHRNEPGGRWRVNEGRAALDECHLAGSDRRSVSRVATCAPTASRRASLGP